MHGDSLETIEKTKKKMNCLRSLVIEAIAISHEINQIAVSAPETVTFSFPLDQQFQLISYSVGPLVSSSYRKPKNNYFLYDAFYERNDIHQVNGKQCTT